MNTIQHREALTFLISKADPRRAARSGSRPMSIVKWTGTAWTGDCVGTAGEVYHPVITLVGQRSFNCTCQDKVQNARELGPCKHVISLTGKALDSLWMLEALEGGSILAPRA